MKCSEPFTNRGKSLTGWSGTLKLKARACYCMIRLTSLIYMFQHEKSALDVDSLTNPIFIFSVSILLDRNLYLIKPILYFL